MSKLRTLVQRTKRLFGERWTEPLETENGLCAGLPDRCVILGGQPRSGTSLLTSILRTSEELFQAYELHMRKPSFLVGNEGRYTQNIFAQLGLPRETFAELVAGHDGMREEMNLGAWVGPKEAVSAEALTGNESECCESELSARGRVVTDLLRASASLHGAERWGFKILGDIVYADVYASVWPKATFLLLIRDPRDHALSVMKLNEQRKERNQPNFYNDLSEVAKGWLETVDQGMEVLRRHGLSHHVLRYEDLVEQPKEEINRLSEALNIDLSRGEDYYKSDFVATHSSRFQHHGNLTKPISTNSVGKWRKQMTEAESEVFWGLAGSVMERWGYSR